MHFDFITMHFAGRRLKTTVASQRTFRNSGSSGKRVLCKGCPNPVRPVCPTMVCQENIYAYGAVSIADGQWDSLILPKANTVCMQIFLDEIASRYPDDRIVMEQAGIAEAG